MDYIDEKPISPTSERLHAELRRLEWAKGLSEETLTAITNTADWVEFHAGDVVIEVESEITHVYFLITGRMQERSTILWARRFRRILLFEGLSLDCLPSVIGSLSHANPGYRAFDSNTIDTVGPASVERASMQIFNSLCFAWRRADSNDT